MDRSWARYERTKEPGRRGSCRVAIAAGATLAITVAGCGTASGMPAAPATSAATSVSPAAISSSAISSPAAALPAGAIGAGDGSGLLFVVSASGGETVVRGYRRSNHEVVHDLRLPGHFALPTVATAGATEGVSYDGRVLVLTDPSSATVSRFAVVEGSLTTPATIVTLSSQFSYDALSPNGSKLYLVEHLPPSGSEHYQVRSYDLALGHLDDTVIADKTRVAEWMAGHPMSRVTVLDGTIVATLYERHGAAPFVHLLHARDGFAQCVDLPAGAAGWRLAGSQSSLTLQDQTAKTRLAIDLQSGELISLS
jgi:hypothetical protein